MKLKDAEKDVTRLAREVVLKRVAIVAAVTVALHLAVAFGIVALPVSAAVLVWVNHGLDALAFVTAALSARAVVTPANPALNPVSSNGLPLVEQGTDSASSSKPDGDAVPVTVPDAFADGSTPAPDAPYAVE